MNTSAQPKSTVSSQAVSPVIPLYPFVFALFPIIALFTANLGQVSFQIFILVAAATVGLTALVFAICGLLLKNRERAALLACWLILYVFLYGSFSEAIAKIHFGDFVFARSMHRLPLYSLLFLALWFGLMKLYRRVPRLTLRANVLSCWLLIVMCLTLAWRWVMPATHAAARGANAPIAPGLLQSENLPDIYYIILDGYAGSETLAKYFAYDNQPFVQSLQRKGFWLPQKPRSNYAMTLLSLGSSLGMDYWQPEDSRPPPNQVRSFVEGHGYEYIVVSSMDPSITSQSGNSHRLRGLLSNAFVLKLVRGTVFDAVALRFKFYSRTIRENLLGSLEELKRMPERGGHKFVFAHILCPHPPYIFKANGEPAAAFSDATLNVYKTPWDDKNGYVQQVRFISARIEEVIDTILQKSTQPPIIIVQGDHGPHLSLPDRLAAPDLYMNILNAYYLPGGGSSGMFDTITPVNSFRAIFNRYLHASFLLLPDRCYYSTFEKPFRFYDVTARTLD